MPHLTEGIESLPPEILNMICKYLEWRDVGNFEKALPQISVSGAKLDAVKRSLKEISIKRNVIEEEIVSIEDELVHFTPHDIMHYIWGISILENNVMCKDREKLELEGDMKCRWWLNE